MQLEEPDDDVETERIVKNKLGYILRSAFYGMKEGLLTGIFLGGFFGILKFLDRGNFPGVRGDEVNEGTGVKNYGGGVRQNKKSSGRSRRPDTRAYSSMDKRQSDSRGGSGQQEKLSNCRINEETVYGHIRESKPHNLYRASRIGKLQTSYSKLPIRSDKYMGTLHSKVDSKKKYSDGKNNDNVAIVGYALIKTTGAFQTESTSLKSIEISSPRQSSIEMRKKEEDVEDDDDDEPPPETSKSSVGGSTGTFISRVSESLKNAKKSASTEKGKAVKSLKGKESWLSSKLEKSTLSVKSGNASEVIVVDSVSPTRSGSERETKDSKSKGSQKTFSSFKVFKSRSKQSVVTETEEQSRTHSKSTNLSAKKNSIGISDEENAEQSRSILIKSLEPDQSEISTRETNELSEDSRLRLKETRKSSKQQSKQSLKPGNTGAFDVFRKSSQGSVKNKGSDRTKSHFSSSATPSGENIYPRMHTPSYLVNAEDVGNGFISPTILTNEDQQSEHETIQSNYSDSLFSQNAGSSRVDLDIENSMIDFGDFGFEDSNISEFKADSPSHIISPSLSDQNRTVKKSSWSPSSTHRSREFVEDTAKSQPTEPTERSNYSVKTGFLTKSVVFTDSERDRHPAARSDLSKVHGALPPSKSILSGEHVSDKSQSISGYIADASQASSAYTVGKLQSGSASISKRSNFESPNISNKPQSGSAYISDRPVIGSALVMNQSHPENISEKSHPKKSYNSSMNDSAYISGTSNVGNGYPSEKTRSSWEEYSQGPGMGNRELSKASPHGGLTKSNSVLIKDVGPDSSRSSMGKETYGVPLTHRASPEKDKGRDIFTSVTDNTLVLCACNCALVLGIICTVITTTRVSLSFK